jgi:hypothetical protein
LVAGSQPIPQVIEFAWAGLAVWRFGGLFSERHRHRRRATVMNLEESKLAVTLIVGLDWVHHNGHHDFTTATTKPNMRSRR